MILRRLGIVLSFVAVVFFPWPLTVLLALLLAAFEPLVPLALGIFADTLYYLPHGSFFPHFTFWGLLVTIVAFFVRSRLKASLVRDF